MPQYEDIGADKPLFGEARPRDRILNLVIGGITSLAVAFTLVSAVVFPHWPPKAVNIYFAVCIVLICTSNLVLIYWYRQGDLEPKFRTLIYYNAFTVILICVCANLYVHEVGMT